MPTNHNLLLQNLLMENAEHCDRTSRQGFSDIFNVTQHQKVLEDCLPKSKVLPCPTILWSLLWTQTLLNVLVKVFEPLRHEKVAVVPRDLIESKKQFWLHIFRISLFSTSEQHWVAPPCTEAHWLSALNKSNKRVSNQAVWQKPHHLPELDHRPLRSAPQTLPETTRRAWIDVWVGTEFTEWLKQLI